jgi:hypothetical protein
MAITIPSISSTNSTMVNLVLVLLCLLIDTTSAKRCQEICTYFTFPFTQGQCWYWADWIGGCQAIKWPQFENKDGTWEDCEGACMCNPFGQNCKACGNCYNTKVVNDAVQENECEDYDEYIAMSHDEKLQALRDEICHGGPSIVTSDGLDIVDLMEQAADADGDGQLSCEEMNRSDWNTMGLDPEHLCE